MRNKIIISVNSTWNLVNFRSGLIHALHAQGYEIVAVSPPDKYVDKLLSLGVKYIPLSIDSKGVNPIADIFLFFRYLRIFLREQPDIYLSYTVKPNIYGSWAAHFFNVPVINNIAGLGAIFIANGWLKRIVKQLYRVALSRSCHVFFQNDEDKDVFLDGILSDGDKISVLPGSGIDLHHFSYTNRERSGSVVNFLLIARMLWDKGVGEYVEAARILKSKYGNINFSLLGFVDVLNPSAISHDVVDSWEKEGVVTYLGATDDVRPFIINTDCIVLPSYREGTPRSLLEAAAMGRSIVTTAVPGCKDVVSHGVNGLLCQPRNIDDLVDKLEQVFLMSADARAEMGRMGRMMIEAKYDEKIVISAYLSKINTLLHSTD